MPSFWQIALQRSEQTQGVWALNDGFLVRSISKDDHSDHANEVFTAATVEEVAADALDTAEAAERTEYDFFQELNGAISQRLDSEVPDDAPLQRDVDEITGIRATSRSAIEQRALKTVVCWKKVNTAGAAAVPPVPPVVVRSVSVATYEARWSALPGVRQATEELAATWRSKNSDLKKVARRLDRENKDWYQAWKSEFLPGTPEGDALAGVDTESSGAAPEILEIAAVVQQGLSLRVTYVPDTGDHATVLDLQWMVDGAQTEWAQVPAALPAGNVIGPFTAGQTVRIRTDVGNSRDASELSPEQTALIQPVAG